MIYTDILVQYHVVKKQCPVCLYNTLVTSIVYAIYAKVHNVLTIRQFQCGLAAFTAAACREQGASAVQQLVTCWSAAWQSKYMCSTRAAGTKGSSQLCGCCQAPTAAEVAYLRTAVVQPQNNCSGPATAAVDWLRWFGVLQFSDGLYRCLINVLICQTFNVARSQVSTVYFLYDFQQLSLWCYFSSMLLRFS